MIASLNFRFKVLILEGMLDKKLYFALLRIQLPKGCPKKKKYNFQKGRGSVDVRFCLVFTMAWPKLMGQANESFSFHSLMAQSKIPNSVTRRAL
jgi:hypothetical protein